MPPAAAIVVPVIVDGERCEARADQPILRVLQARGIEIPTLCHDDRLVPVGYCRSCLVEVNGGAHLLPACMTMPTAGMVVVTRTEALVAYRRSVVELLARRYPASAVADAPGKEFHRWLGAFGLSPSGAEAADAGLQDRSHPYIAVDMSRCIECERCVRICREVQGQDVWHVRNRGDETRIVPDGPTLLESSCVSCGACVDTCPTSALTDRRLSPSEPPTAWTRTTCPYCGTGCEMRVGTRNGAIVSIRPEPDAPVSRGHLCVKGRYAFDFVTAPDRITEPMIREADGWRRVSWDEAIGFVAARLRAIVARHGPDSVGVLGSARATNEDNYVAQKFARLAIGTNNVDCCARVCHAPSAAGLKLMLGSGMATNAFDDIELARTLMVLGANATEDHPIVGARIRQAARRGTRLIVVDPRRVELAAEADIHLAIRPGTNVPLLNAMAHVILSEGLADAAFLESRVDGVEAYAQSVAPWTPARAAETCGVEASAIQAAARLYATGPPAMTVHGLGLTEHVQGTDGVMALIDLALLTGNIGRPGAGVNPLRGQNNVQGAAHMGCEPGTLPGSAAIDPGRAAVEAQWGAPLPAPPGLHMLAMMDAAIAGRFKALWAIGYDVYLTNARAEETARALGALELLIVQDLFLTESARAFGTVFLPACSSFEHDGTFMNAERRIQRVRAAVPPVGGARADWRILADVAAAMGCPGFAFSGPEAIWDEVRAVAPGTGGMTYARLESGGLHWPCPTEDHPGTVRLHENPVPRFTLRPIEDQPTPERPTVDYPMILTTGRTLYHFNAGTMTMRTPNATLLGSDVLDVADADARALGIADGDRVRVVSAYGAAVLPARVSGAVRPGQLFATFHTADVFLNRVTGPHRDGRVATSEYKVTAVRIEPAPG